MFTNKLNNLSRKRRRDVPEQRNQKRCRGQEYACKDSTKEIRVRK